jgi:palmitoyltransferase
LTGALPLLGVAVPVLMSWHLYMVSQGETSIESHDNAFLESKARAEGLVSSSRFDMSVLME